MYYLFLLVFFFAAVFFLAAVFFFGCVFFYNRFYFYLKLIICCINCFRQLYFNFSLNNIMPSPSCFFHTNAFVFPIMYNLIYFLLNLYLQLMSSIISSSDKVIPIVLFININKHVVPFYKWSKTTFSFLNR